MKKEPRKRPTNCSYESRDDALQHNSCLSSTEKQRERKNTSSRTKSPIVGMRGLLITAGPFAIAPISRKHLFAVDCLNPSEKSPDGKLLERFQPKSNCNGRNMCLLAHVKQEWIQTMVAWLLVSLGNCITTSECTRLDVAWMCQFSKHDQTT